MAVSTTVFTEPTSYKVVVTDDTEEIAVEYCFGKNPPDGQTTEQYLQNCKREAELLVVYEIARRQPLEKIII